VTIDLDPEADIEGSRRFGEVVVIPPRAARHRFGPTPGESAAPRFTERGPGPDSAPSPIAPRPAADLARMLQSLLMTRIKADACIDPAREPTQYAEDEAMFRTLAAVAEHSDWAPVIEASGVARLLLEPTSVRSDTRWFLNMYWLGEGMVPLAWLLGVTPVMPPIDEPGDFPGVAERVPLPHTNVVNAQAFVSNARWAVLPEFAAGVLQRLEADRNDAVASLNALLVSEKERALKGRKGDQKALQSRVSRSVERARTLAWALGRTTSPPAVIF
jgi:hypothetical protein